MLRSGVTARRIGDARATIRRRPATGDRAHRAPPTYPPFSVVLPSSIKYCKFTQDRRKHRTLMNPRDMQFMRRVAQSFSTRTLESYKYTCGSNKHDS